MEDSEIIANTSHGVTGLPVGYYAVKIEDLDNPGRFIYNASNVTAYMADVSLIQIAIT